MIDYSLVKIPTEFYLNSDRIMNLAHQAKNLKAESDVAHNQFHFLPIPLLSLIFAKKIVETKTVQLYYFVSNVAELFLNFTLLKNMQSY